MTQLQPDIFVNNRPDTDGDEEEDYFDYFYDEPGSEPGTLIIEPDAKPSRIILIDYDEDNAVRKVDITEDYNNQLLVISQMVRLKEDESGFDTEQVSFVLGKRYLLSFQEEELQDCFEIVRDRIRTSQGRVRKSGADYLTYLLLDTIIDGYFPVVEHYEDRIEALEDAIISNPDRDTMQEIYDVRRELLALRRLFICPLWAIN